MAKDGRRTELGKTVSGHLQQYSFSLWIFCLITLTKVHGHTKNFSKMCDKLYKKYNALGSILTFGNVKLAKARNQILRPYQHSPTCRRCEG